MKVLVFAFICIYTFKSFAQDNVFKDYQVQNPKISSPKRGSLKGDFSSLADKALTNRTGSFNVFLPISFPSERGEIQQTYNVSYSPGYGISEYGIGWSSRLTISRFREIGQIDYTTSDDLLTPFGQLTLGSDGYYYSKDIKQAIRAEINSDEIIVYKPNGTIIYFGSNTDPIYTEKNLNSDIHTWYIRESVSKTNQKTLFEYSELEEDEKAKLSKISYGGLNSDFQYEIEFLYEKNQTPLVSYELGYKKTLGYRVKNIILKSNESSSFLERYRYTLSYDESIDSPAFYLKSMLKTFSSGSSLPQISFNYDLPNEYLSSVNWNRENSLDTLASEHKGILTYRSSVSTPDFNNDGMADLEIGDEYKRYIQTENGYEEYTVADPIGDVSGRCLFPVVHSRKSRKFFRPLGPNTELYVYERFKSSTNSYIEYCKVNGERVGFIELPKFWEDSKTTIFADINNDTLPDLIRLRNSTYEVMINTSSGGVISFDPPYYGQSLNTISDIHGFWIMDMNADGANDLVIKGSSSLFVHYGNGQGQFSSDYHVFSFYLPNGSKNSKNLSSDQILFSDLNKDGLPDILLQGDGYISMHLNTSDRFVQKYIPGLFASPSFFRNLIVEDLTGSGNKQLATTINTADESYVLTLSLDRPSLGMLKSVNDGQGNIINYSFSKSKAQAGVAQRKTILSNALFQSTGEKDRSTDLEYSSIATHTLTKAFLSFETIKEKIGSRYEKISTFSYDQNNLEQLISVSETDSERINFKKKVTNSWEQRSSFGISFPILLSTSLGFTNDSESESSMSTTSYTYDYDNICKTQTIKSGSNKSLTTDYTYESLASFSDALSCLTKTVELTGSGVESYENFNHDIEIVRDLIGRTKEIKLGSNQIRSVQLINYGSNERVSDIEIPGSGITYYNYDSNYRLNQIINPDGSSKQITSFEFLNDSPKELQTLRNSLSLDESFRFDDLARLDKQWDNTGIYSQSNPKNDYRYIFANSSSPAKVFADTLIEKTLNQLDSSQAVFLNSASGSELAQIMETQTYLKVSKLTDIDKQNKKIKTFQDHLISSSTDLDLLEYQDLDFINNDQTNEVEQDFFKQNLSQTSAVQTGVNKLSDREISVLSGNIIELDRDNNNSNYEMESYKNSLSQIIKKIDENDNEYDFDYDSLGRIRKITFPNGDIQSANYDNETGKLISINRTNIGSIEYLYESTNLLLKEKTFKDKNNLLTTREFYTYDSSGRISGKTLTQYNSNGTVKESINYDYDYDGDNLDPADRPGNLGFLTGVTGPKFVKTFKYRPDGKLLFESFLGENEHLIEKTYSYFSQGELSSQNILAKLVSTNTIVSNFSLTYEYDRFGNLVLIKKDGSNFATLSYNDFNELELVDIINNKTARYLYDSLTRMSRDYLELDGSDTLLSQILTFNNRGLISQSQYGFNNRTIDESYTYFNTKWLSDMNRVDSGGADLDLEYDYDSFGLMSELIRDGVSEAHIQTPTFWTINGTNYSLDNSGRVISRALKTFEYGPNRRIQVASDNGSLLANYYYDEENNPAAKTYANGDKEYYFGDLLFAGSNFYMPISIGNRVVGYFKNNTFIRSSQNHLNTSFVNENDSVNITTPFGERVSRSEVNKVLDFTLKGYDIEIGAVRMGRRFYDEKAKRFLSPDNYFIENQNEVLRSNVEGNLVSYVSNNPIVFYDPSGSYEEVSNYIENNGGKDGNGVPMDKNYNPLTHVSFTYKYKGQEYEASLYFPGTNGKISFSNDSGKLNEMSIKDFVHNYSYANVSTKNGNVTGYISDKDINKINNSYEKAQLTNSLGVIGLMLAPVKSFVVSIVSAVISASDKDIKGATATLVSESFRKGYIGTAYGMYRTKSMSKVNYIYSNNVDLSK